jgi:hypothetical protein
MNHRTKMTLRDLTALLLCCYVIYPIGLSAFAQSGPNNLTEKPEMPGTNLADDTIIITTAPGADMDKVKEVLDEVHGTVINKLHIEKENYWTLFVKPEQGKADETFQTLLDKKDKNFKAITRNNLAKPLTP